MAVWSSLALRNIAKVDIGRDVITALRNKTKVKGVNYVPIRSSHDRTLVIKTSSYDGFKFKDLVYFYLAIGAIPLVGIALYCNIFIGPATLALPPEGYTPKPWEYHSHPITRFFAKYITPSPQEHYERTLHNAFYTKEKKMIQELEWKVKKLMRERLDYQAWYFQKKPMKYGRQMHEDVEKAENTSQYRAGWIKSGWF